MRPTIYIFQSLWHSMPFIYKGKQTGRKAIPAVLALALMTIPAHSQTISGDITASGPGTVVTETFDGDMIVTGTAYAVDQGELDLTVTDNAQVTGNLTGDRDGLIRLDASGNAHLSGALEVENGADAEVSMSGNAEYSGTMRVENSGGYLNMSLTDSASVSGQITSGSWSRTFITLDDETSLTGGLLVRDGGNIIILANGNNTINGDLTATGNGVLSISVGDNTTITGPLTVDGNSQATLDLNGNTTYTGDMSITGSGRLFLQGAVAVDVEGDLYVSGGGTADITMSGASTFIGDVTNDPGGATTMIFSDTSSFTGDVYTGAGTTYTLDLNDTAKWIGSSTVEWGTANVSLNDAGTAWYVTQSGATSAANGASGTENASVVSNLSLAEGSWVYLGAQNYTMSSAADRVQLDILNLSGNGNFELRPYVEGLGMDARNTGDLIYVTNTGGDHNLYVPSAQLKLGAVAVNGEERLMVVRSIDGNGNFNLYQGNYVDIGHLKYNLVQQDTNWYLVAGIPVPLPGIPPDGGNGGGDGGNGGGDGGNGGGDGGNGGGDGGNGGGDGGNGGGDGGNGGGDGGNGGGDGGNGGGDGGNGGGDGGNGGGDGGNGGGDGGNGGGDGGNGGGDGGNGGGGIDIGDLDPGFGVQPNYQWNNTAQASVSFMMTNYLVNYIEVQTLLERMGALRHNREGDVWLRAFGGELHSFSLHQLPGFTIDYYGFQAGVDRALSGISDDLYVGLMAGYTEAKPEHNFGHSKARSYHIGAYALYGTEDDFYIDAILKYARIRDRFDVRDSQGARVTGNGDNNAYTASLEVGKRFYLQDKQEGWYLEPQAQATYTYQDSLSLTASNGLHSRMDSYSSLLLRASALVGFSSKSSSIPYDVYAKVGYIHEALADIDVHFNGRYNHSFDFKGGWGDVGVGVSAEFRPSHNVYLEGGYARGDRFEQKRLNLGYRFTF